MQVIEFSLDEEPSEKWVNYVRGVLKQFPHVPVFEAAVASDVPIGAGVCVCVCGVCVV